MSGEIAETAEKAPQFLKTSRPAVAARKQKGIGRLAREAKPEIGRSRKNDVTYKLRE